MSKKEKLNETIDPQVEEKETLENTTEGENAESLDNEDQNNANTSGQSPSEEGQSNEKNLEGELKEMKEKYLRLYADFENHRKRVIKERLELIKTASRDTLSALLPVLDDFDRAKKSADDENSPESFSDGVKLVYQKLYGILKEKGLKQMDSTGSKFDPELHEAVTEIPAPSDEQKGVIIDTIEKGYFLNDKIIRHAKVVVGK